MKEEPKLIIYKSSAGSGKTFTLVLEYLKQVLTGTTGYRNILAVTFTNKATEEMKSRVIESLMEISEGRQEELQKLISEQTGMPLPSIPEKAQKVLVRILHDYSRFAISTIDSFFSKIVRALARELRLSVRFDIELDQSAVSEDITGKLFNDIEADTELRSWLEQFIIDKLDRNKGWQLRNDIINISKQLFSEKYRSIFPNGAEPPDKEFLDKIKRIRYGFESGMRSDGEKFLEIIAKHNLTVDDFFHKKAGPAGYMAKITGITDPEKYKPGKRFHDAVEDPSKWTSGTSKKREEIMALAETELIPLALNVMNRLAEELPPYFSSVSIMKNIYMAGIIGKLDEKLNLFRTENDVVLISDNNNFLRQAMEDTDSHFMFEKSGNVFKHFMLDEFQDTSDFQWQNLLPLITNALGEGHSTLIVGDAKQSIYRWRGGNMDLIQSQVQRNLDAFKSITTVRRLDANYRSRETIVNFNNSFFTVAPGQINILIESDDTGHPFTENEIVQEWKKGITGDGFVKIKFFPENSEPESQESEEESESVKWKEQTCAETFETINKCLENNYSYSDIAILTRTNDEARLITGYLIESGITEIISPESMLLNRDPSVQLIINSFRYIVDTWDEIALNYLVNYYENIHPGKDNKNFHGSFSKDRRQKTAALPSEFTAKLISFRKMSLYDLSEALTVIFGLSSAPDAYIQRLLDLVLDFGDKDHAGISDFLDWWNINQDTEKCSVIIPSDTNAIKVMTIHKSKGLQFPVVIVPFAAWKLTPKSDNMLWVESDIEPFNERTAHLVRTEKILSESVFSEDYHRERKLSVIDNLNMLYVAQTRAENELHIFSRIPGKSNNEDGITEVNQLLFKVLTIVPEWNKQLENQELPELILGFRQSKTGDDKQSKTNDFIKKWISNPWKDKLRMVVNKQKISMNDPDMPELTYGVHFHAAASLIDRAGQGPEIADEYIRNMNLDDATADKLKEDIGTMLQIADGQNWFDSGNKIINEGEILLNDGTLLRPDRLIINGKKACVIDYKTGSRDKHHTTQVQQYANALKQMGYVEQEIFLLYISEKELVRVETIPD